MIQDEFEMENQGYEEEAITRALPFNRQYLVESSVGITDDTTRSSSKKPTIQGSNTIIGIRSFRSEPEAHVYEDIVVSGLENSISSDCSLNVPINQSIINENDQCNELESLKWSQTARMTINNNVKNFPSTNEPDSLLSSVETENSINNFHRNLTLPLTGSVRTIDGAKNPSRYSVRVTNREKNGCLSNDVSSSLYESSLSSSSMMDGSCRISDEIINGVQVIDKPGGRRRRKKDCKHCKIKANGIRESGDSIPDSIMHDDSTDPAAVTTMFPLDVSSGRVHTVVNNKLIGREEKERLGIEPIFTLPDGKLPSFNLQKENQTNNHQDVRVNSIFSISKNINISGSTNIPKSLNYDKNNTDVRLVPIEINDDRALITPMKNRCNGMKVNSIYAQDHWHYKDVPVFVTDVKEKTSFQRAYSLPTRTQTPSSQNRVNLRRSVRGEPPPHPAQLRKNRHGWTLHFARPLDGTGCTRSIVLLLIAILALLGIGGIALYIVFEPEKLQIIQQYLRSSSTPNVSSVANDTFDTIRMGLESDTTETTTTTTLPTPGLLLTESLAAFSHDTTLYLKTEPEIVSITSPSPVDLNATRHCDDCYDGEVCVALVDDDVPFCRIGPDLLDPTGCAGLCIINRQKCHRLDVDAFRCVELEHYCLDDEWTCLNTLCIPLTKHCDGHMNCYDHSDEYDCVCDPQTHFQCGNETSCLPLERRCDGKIDCWDATDEINCTLTCPSSGDFTCSNGECILKARFCDGLRDCTDGSDEPHGCQGRCNKHEFSCHNGRCITKAMKCNGIDDCDDNSDEQHCRDRIS